MLLVFLSPLALAGFVKMILDVTADDREMRRMVKASIRKEMNPPAKRSARWIA